MIPHDISNTHEPSESRGEEERGDSLCFLNYSPNISFSRLYFTQASVPAPIWGFPQTLHSWCCSTEHSPGKPQRKKKHISQVQGGQTLTYVLYIRTEYRYESINLRDLSFHVRSAYVYALTWHMSHFSYITFGSPEEFHHSYRTWYIVPASEGSKFAQEKARVCGKFLSVSNRAERNFSTWDISTFFLLSSFVWVWLILCSQWYRLIMARWADSLQLSGTKSFRHRVDNI